MTIIEWLKKEDSARVMFEDRWLVYDNEEWIVYERKYGKKVTTVICRTPSEEEAVKCLTAVE